MLNLDGLILPLFIVWFLGVFVIIFRRGIEAMWKISAVLIFVFYMIWFRDALILDWERYRDHFSGSVVLLAAWTGELTGFALLLFWPVVSMTAAYTLAGGASKSMLRTFVLLTLFYWMFWFLNRFVYPLPVAEWAGHLPDKIQWELPKPPTH
ncbi:MAG: hypothetical protein HY042_09160 [Spirochaetia bacterium]|nr:hypothetical protein [Spirochaetia bacterium]